MSDTQVVRAGRDARPVPPPTEMSFRPGETAAEGILRMTQEQAGLVHWLLTTPDVDRDDAIHEARKAMKRTRSLLRLVRDEIGADVYARENGVYRDVARMLSRIRISAVMTETFDKVRERYPEAVADADAAAIRRLLEERHAAALAELEASGVMAEAAGIIADARARLNSLPVRCDDFSYMGKGIQRVYRRGRRAMHRAEREPATTNYHEWRKRVKYLRDQVRVLAPIWPRPMQALYGELDRLAGTLGFEHDLADLQDAFRGELDGEGLPVAHLLPLMDAYREELRQLAHALGERIYAEPARAFRRRLQAYWQAEGRDRI